jgi:hypothetical protein
MHDAIHLVEVPGDRYRIARGEQGVFAELSGNLLLPENGARIVEAEGSL